MLTAPPPDAAGRSFERRERENMPVQRLCTIAEVAQLNPFATSMTLEAGDMSPAVGQFVHIKCGDGLLLRRPISICDWQVDEPDNLLRIVFEARGEGTEWLSRRRAGEQLDVLGPLGHGFALERDGKYLLVGGGIGVPPLLACARRAEGRCTAVLGFRNADRAMLLDEFRSSCADVTVMSDDGSLGEHGFVDAGVRRVLEAGRDYDAVLACGPKAMLRSVVRAAEEFGVPCQVSMEERMGCGVGACLVCACDMADGSRKHVCKDGPVFDAREVNWDA